RGERAHLCPPRRPRSGRVVLQPGRGEPRGRPRRARLLAVAVSLGPHARPPRREVDPLLQRATPPPRARALPAPLRAHGIAPLREPGPPRALPGRAVPALRRNASRAADRPGPSFALPAPGRPPGWAPGDAARSGGPRSARSPAPSPL